MADELESSIGLFEAVAVQIGVVVGAGLFSVTGVATGFAGPAVAISYVIAFTVVALSIVPTAVLGALYPTSGGNYRYASRLWSPRVAFLSTWGMAVSVLAGGLPLFGLTFGQYLDALVPVEPRLVGVIVVTLFFVVNLIGIEPAARVQQLMAVTLVGSLIAFVGFGVSAVDTANLTPIAPNGPAGVLTGGALLYFVCMGANFIVDIGGELRDAALVIPHSFGVSLPVILLMYVATSVVAVGAVGWETLATENLTAAAAVALSPALETVFVVGGGLFAIATTINAVYMIAPKYLMVMAEDRALPSALSAVHPRFGTPHWALVTIYLVSMVFLLSPLSLEGYSTLMGFGSILLVIPVMGSAIALVRYRPEEYAAAPFHVRPRLLVGLAAGAVVCNTVLLGLLASESTTTFLTWLGALGLGGIYYVVRSGYLARHGIDLRERMTRPIPRES